MLAAQSTFCKYAKNGEFLQVMNECFKSLLEIFVHLILQFRPYAFRYPGTLSVTLFPIIMFQLFRNLQRLHGNTQSQWSGAISCV